MKSQRDTWLTARASAIAWLLLLIFHSGARAQVYEKVFSFTEANAAAAGKKGGVPIGNLVRASDGNFYGTTNSGGTAGLGTVFKVTPGGVLTVLVEFTGNGTSNKGSYPYGALVQASDGNFYGTTTGGGANGQGTVFKLTPIGVLTTLVEFTGIGASNRGALPFAALVQGTDGNFYGTTYQGGATNNGTVFKMTSAGVLTTLVELTGSGASNKGTEPTGGLVQGSDGNFYGTTAQGGATNNGTVFRITPAGVLTTLVEFTVNGANNKGQYPKGGLVQGGDGNYYGTTERGGATSNGTVFKMTPGGALTTLVEFTYNGANNKGSFPASGLVLGSDGNFYGTTYLGGGNGKGTAFMLTPAGVLTTLVDFTGNGASNKGSNPDGGLVQGSDGNYYGTTAAGGATNNGTVYKLTAAGALTTLAEFTGSGAGNGRFPYAGLVQGGDGNFYGTTFAGGTMNDGTVFKLTPGRVFTTLVEFSYSGPTNKGREPFADLIQGVDGNLYGTTVAGGNSYVGTAFKMTPAGVLTTLVEFTGNGASNKGSYPVGKMVLATDGNFYGTTSGGTALDNGTVFRMTPAGVLTTLVEFTGNGASNKGRSPWTGGLIQGSDGNIYGTTSGGGTSDNGTVFKMTLAGVLTTLVEFTGNGASNKGANPQARLRQGSDGNYYGTTPYGGAFGSGTVFKMTSAGVLTTLVEFTFNGASNKGSNPYAGLLQSNDGNFYGTTYAGGNGLGSGYGTVFKMTPSGVLTTLFEFFDDPVDASPRGDLILAADGNIYGTASGGVSAGAGSVFRLIFPGAPEVILLGTAGVEVLSNGAVITVKINARGSATTNSIEYGTDGVNFPNVLPLNPSPLNGYLTTVVGTTLGGLPEGIVHYYRVRATSSAGTTVSPVGSFATLAKPAATVSPATNLAPNSAQLNGTVNAHNYGTTVLFEYGTDGNTFPNQVAATPTTVSGSGNVTVNAPIAGLTKGTTYYYRINAINEGGITVSGVSSFATLTDPTATVGPPTLVTSQSAILNGFVNAHGATTSVTFEYGSNNVTFPNSVGATPATVTGNGDTAVSAVLSGLSQGATYYYRVKGTSAGGVGVSTSATLIPDILSGFARVGPPAPPPAQGFVVVTLTPSGIASGWRFVGEQQWRASGIPVGGLASGDRQIEFRPVPGYIQPLKETVAVTSGGAAALFTGEYFLSASGGATGGLNVVLKPDALADPLVPVAQRAQWRLLGEDDALWRNSGVTIPSLVPGIYLVECKPVSGRTTPPPIPVAVPAGSTRSATLTYALADASAGTPPSVLTFETVNNNPDLPYAFVGQIRSDVGAATGFVVKPRVVATAAHVVFDDGALAYVTGLQWLFQRDAGTYEPKPQVPRGFYIFNGYAAQRTTEATPGQSSPQSQNLDAAALYFLEDAGRGGYGGYLGSDRNDNEFLLSSKQKMLVGYPVDGIASANQGRMHATPPDNVTFANAFGYTFATADIRSSGGNSGGPLCVQFDDGKYYAAAIYLGGSAQTVVRSIDSGVIDLFNRAETSGNGGANNTGGGISQVDAPFTGDTFALASLTVSLQPPEAVAAGAAWQLGGATLGSGAQRSNLTPGNYTVSFTSVSGFQTPSPQVVTLTGGNVTGTTGTYVAVAPPKQDQSISFPALPNRQMSDPALGLGASASSGLPVSYTVVSGPASLSGNSVTPTGVGTVTIRASQPGNGSFNPAPDVDQSFSVARANQTISFGALGNKTYGDSAFTVSATATSGLAPTFSVASGPASVSGNTVTLTGVGSVTIRASQAGNGNYNAAPDENRSFSVAKAGQAISFGALATRTYGEPPFGVSASASSGLIPSFSIVSGPATISGNTVTLTGAGTVTVRASQGGDANYNAASSVDQSFGVNKATPAISWPAPAAITYGTALSGTQLNATANIAGTFVYTPAAGVVLGAGSNPMSVTFTPVDTANYNATTGGQTLTVNKATLSAKAEGKTKVQGDPNPALTILYSGFVNGDTSAAVTVPPTAATTATTASIVGSYPITLTGGSAANYNLTLQNGILFVYDGSSPVTGIQSVVGTGYVAGGTVTVTNTVIYSGTLTGLGWSILPPNGWSYAAGGGSEGDIKPNVGDTSLLEWGWTTIPPSLVTFTYTLTVPAGTTGPQTLAALVRPRQLNTQFDVLAQPDPLTIDQVTHHTADTSHDFRFSLSELLRVIELYNTRNGTVRTGAYAVDANNFEDGFTPDAARLNTAVVSLLKYHAADLNHDGKLGLSELLRVIELYNFRNGTVRTGQYHVQAGTEDSFAPGP